MLLASHMEGPFGVSRQQVEISAATFPSARLAWIEAQHPSLSYEIKQWSVTSATALLSAHQGDASDIEKLDGIAFKPNVRGKLSVGRLGWITVNVRKDK